LVQRVGNPESAPNEQKIKPIESISISSVHFSLNLPQASQFLGMTNQRAAAHLGMVGGGWTESKKSHAPWLLFPPKPFVFNKVIKDDQGWKLSRLVSTR
jgi:hypothetical protein